MSLIKEVYDGKPPAQDPELSKLADHLVGKGKNGTSDSGRTSPSSITPAS